MSASADPSSVEDDSGDIALSLPRSTSDRALSDAIVQHSLAHSTRSSSSVARPAHPSTVTPTPRARRDVTAPASSTPLARRLWNDAAVANGYAAPQASPPRSASASSRWPDLSVDAGPSRPYSAAANPWRPPSPSPSPSPTPTPVNESPQSMIPTIGVNGPSSGAGDSPTIAARRQITRSHSLNVRIPSVDLTQRSATSVVSATSSQPPLGLPASNTHLAPSPRPPPLVDGETANKMSRWVKELVVCNFDLERGPVIERRAVGRRWGPGEKENVAFSSFPDTSLFTEGSIQFSFKIRHVPPDPKSLAYPEPPSPLPARADEAVLANSAKPHHARKSSVHRDKAAEYRAWDERGREWLYGFVWFQQRRDRGIARGFMQKSVVILTHLPFPALFSAVLARIAPSFFKYGYSALEVACHGIASWPDPCPDALLELPLLSEVLTVKLPDSTDNPQVAVGATKLRGEPEPTLASLPPSTPLRAFATFLPSLWSIWECLVLAEPVLVIAPDPRTCSEIVWWLREMVRPIPLAGDFRPYLHIHDHDFSLLVNSNKPQAGVVVGVTNPFFRNAASHWPNVIAVPSGRAKPRTQNQPKADAPEGFLTKRNRSVQKDRALLKRLEALVAEGKLDDPEGNEALRMHFQQLTERMLVPLNRYFQTLVPPRSPAMSASSSSMHMPVSTSGSSTPNLPPPPALSLSTLKPFSHPAFLTHLRTRGPNPLLFKAKGLTGKSRVENDFYAAFCKSGCFAGWLSARVESLGIAVASNTLAATDTATQASRPNSSHWPQVQSDMGLGLDVDDRFSASTRSSTDVSASS